MRLRLDGGGGGCLVGGEPASVAVDGEACVVVGSALSLAAEERVTLCDMGKYLLRLLVKRHPTASEGVGRARVSDRRQRRLTPTVDSVR